MPWLQGECNVLETKFSSRCLRAQPSPNQGVENLSKGFPKSESSWNIFQTCWCIFIFHIRAASFALASAGPNTVWLLSPSLSFGRITSADTRYSLFFPSIVKAQCSVPAAAAVRLYDIWHQTSQFPWSRFAPQMGWSCLSGREAVGLWEAEACRSPWSSRCLAEWAPGSAPVSGSPNTPR